MGSEVLDGTRRFTKVFDTTILPACFFRVLGGLNHRAPSPQIAERCESSRRSDFSSLPLHVDLTTFLSVNRVYAIKLEDASRLVAPLAPTKAGQRRDESFGEVG